MKTSLQFSATKPVNLGFKTFSLVSQDGQKFTPTGGTVLESATAVPNWLRDDTTRTLFGMKTSLMTSLFVWNIIGVVAHLSLAIITIAVAAIENPGGLDLNLPALPVYVTTMNTTRNIRNTMINNTTMNNTTMNTTMNFDLVFDKTWVDPLPLGWLTVSFFLLSAFFHGFSVFTSMFDYFNWAKPGFLPGLWGSYFYHIANCYNPGRWIEYSFSASTMILTIAISSFVRDVYLVFALWTLTFCTMTYGWVTEVINTAEPTKGRPQLWKLHSGSDDLVVPSFLAPLQRLVPHMIGYVPYACVWIILLHSFLFNTYDDGSDSRARGPPDWVVIAVVGQMVVFSCFGITQFVLLLFDHGAYYYPLGEISYLILSLVSKGMLGMLLIFNVAMYSSIDDAFGVA